MESKLVERGATLVLGLATRTTNAAEAEPATARIGKLWQRVFATGVPGRVPAPADPGRPHAVYTDYESDHHGEYTLVVGAAARGLEPPPGLVAVSVPAGRYRLFVAEGPMPAALIETWGRIWAHYDRSSSERRAFGADLEVHGADGKVEVYVSIV
jgi:predicted transcriptional regulator YdeE